ncbi:helix-turn-helix domain-containing protein [Polycladidibacter stylochi]|uniref:helix-turn-helix domain-containing protein n=1 Tax=Polycladidibacter stylochi TaxID=1807766 RepID=UPI00082BB8F4|nr:helix-turn-helix domain-containing protein [Pseudovibrio stylochi]
MRLQSEIAKSPHNGILIKKREPNPPRDSLQAVGWITTAHVALSFGVCPSALVLTSRGMAKVALARQVAMYILHVALGYSHSNVGRVFGRDRTTVSHACKVVEEMRDQYHFDSHLSAMESQIQKSVSCALFPFTTANLSKKTVSKSGGRSS